MPRPCKRRRICGLPSCRHFGPTDISAENLQVITMTLDEFETIRLIDLEGLKQEECAGQMKIARTTAQAIYNSARSKLAECLINGKELNIAGGNYELCDGSAHGCMCGCSCRHQFKNDTDTNDIKTNEEQGIQTV